MSEDIGGTLTEIDIRNMRVIEEMVADLEDHGVELYTFGGKVKLRMTQIRMTAEMKEKLAACKRELIRYLHRRTYARARLKGLCGGSYDFWFLEALQVTQAFEVPSIQNAMRDYILGEIGPSKIDTAFHEWIREKEFEASQANPRTAITAINEVIEL